MPLNNTIRTKEIHNQMRLRRLDHKLEIAKAQIRKTQNLRLWTGAFTIAGIVFSAMRPELRLGLPIVIVFLMIFPLLVRFSRQWTQYQRALLSWRDFETRQQARRQGSYRVSESESELAQADLRGLSQDLDLHGHKSLLSQINETFSVGGLRRLFDLMIQDPVRENIQTRQSLLKELSVSRWFFLRFRISNPTRENAKFSSSELLKALESFPAPSLKLTGLFLLVVLTWTAATVFVLTHPLIWGAFLGAHLIYLLTAGPLLSRGEGVLHHFSDLAPSFAALESSRVPKRLAILCKTIREERPARRIQRFNWTLAALSIESHPLVYLVVNFFLPWSAVFSFILIHQVAGVRRNLKTCFDELEEIEVVTSLVILTTDQTSVFPTIAEKVELKGTNFFHPLIDASKRVTNDFGFSPSEKMILLTGSNMSGKSTFLRTIGLNQVLANMGAPVFAESFTTFPFRIRSCIRVSDSIEQGFSYFYAEVQRLKSVLGDATKEPPVLYLIDEIFRGTNNRERLIGSQSVIKHLVATPSIGFITTHDLELTQIATGDRRVHNYHFRDEARENQMYFSYHLQDGPSPTTNALKIMKQAGLPIE